MDKERAKFLLSSFRPDGADAGSSDFAEALSLVAENRELGEWLAQERAEDAAFAQALNEVPIPDGLRDEILAVLEYDGKTAEVDEDLDGLFMGGLENITPPAGLRDQILASMEVEQAARLAGDEDSKVVDIKLWRWISAAAVAAVVAVGTFITSIQGDAPSANDTRLVESHSDPLTTTPGIRQVAVRSAMLEMATKLSSPDKLNINKDLGCTMEAKEFLRGKDHPVPETLPVGLEDAEFVGVRDMYLSSGQPVSLLCFNKEGMGMIHLIAVKTQNISDAAELTSMKSISLKSCYECVQTSFNIARWIDGDMTYIILTKGEKSDMVKLF